LPLRLQAIRFVTQGPLGRLTPEQRIYAAALAVGLLLNALALFSALQAQGRFPQIQFQLPNLDNISLPGRPVLRPILDPGELRTDVSEAATVGHLTARLGDDVVADVDIPPPGVLRPAKLVLRANLPRLFASDPPLANFRALRLVDVYLVDARTGARVDPPNNGLGLDLRVAIRPIDLERAGADPSRLLLLRLDLAHDTWTDTHASVADGYLVAHSDSLAPFAIGLVVPDEKPDAGFLGLFGPPPPPPTATPTPTPTDEPAAAPAEATPTPTRVVIVDPLPGLPLPDNIVSLAPMLTPLTPTPTPEASATPAGEPTPVPTSAPTPRAASNTDAQPTSSPAFGVTQQPTIQPTATPTPVPTTPTPTPSPVVTATVQPTLVATPTPRSKSSSRVIDIAAPPPSGDVGRVFEIAAGTVLRPGDQVVTNVIVFNSGTLDLTYAMKVDATQSSSLDTDRSGLQLIISRCGATFTVCNETVYSGPAVVSTTPMGGPETVGSRQQTGLRPWTQDYLQLRVSFPASAGNPVAGATSVLRFTWTSAQAF
jgi:hypothetical protein